MRFRSPFFALLGFVAVSTVASAPSAYAQALLSNADTPASGQGSFIGPNTAGGTNNNGQKAVTFSTGTFDLSLTSFQASLDIDTGTAPGAVRASLHLATATDDPGTLITTLADQTITTPFGPATTYTFTPSSAVTLSAGTRYSILLDYVSGATIFWYGTNPQTPPTARNNSGITNVVYRTSGNDGASYTSSTTLNRLQVNGVVVTAPEPGSLALGLFGLASGAIALRKRRN